MTLRMASTQKLPKSRFWYASYRDAAGGQHLKSTKIEHTPEGTDPKQRAALAATNKRNASEWANRIEEEERGNAAEAQLRKTLNDLSQRVNKRRLEFAETESYLRKWLDGVRGTKSPATHVRYAGTVEGFLESLGPKAKATLADITPQDVQAYTQSRLDAGKNPTTVIVDVKALNRPFALALRQGLILTNPVQCSEAPKAEQESKAPFSKDQLAKIFKAIKGEWKTAAMLSYWLGARLGDCTQFKSDFIDFEKHIVTFRPQKSRRKKRDITLPMDESLEAYLLDVPGADEPGNFLCPTLAKVKIGGRRGLSRQFSDIIEKAGVEQEWIEPAKKGGRRFGKYGFHSFRHTFTSLLANSGVAHDVRKLMTGHTDDKSHAKYTHATVETMRAALANLPKFK
jgi:integrase